MIGKMEHWTPRCIVRSSGVAAGVVLGLMWLSPLPSRAQTYTVLYSFTGNSDGAIANGSLVRDRAGNLSGTTIYGGNYGMGTAFKLDTAGNETVTTFDYANGEFPQPGLIRHKEVLYDTAFAGGYNGSGAVIEINDRGKATLLYSFCSLANCTDGANPEYGLTSDSAGNLYGTTNLGGAHNAGAVFKVNSQGQETVLYSFCPGGGNCSDGGNPAAGAVRDSDGNLYGVAEGGPNTDCGGSPCGVVWKLDTSGKESVLHAFTGSPSDGYWPWGLLTIDGKGNLYGVTDYGGSGTACSGGSSGCGTVFKVDANGNETVLHNFTGGRDGATPGDGPLVLDKQGNLYGEASFGGAHAYGAIFKLNTLGRLKVLYSFHGQTDGGIPESGLLLDKQGMLYGEAATGGDLSCSVFSSNGCGVVFKITP